MTIAIILINIITLSAIILMFHSVIKIYNQTIKNSDAYTQAALDKKTIYGNIEMILDNRQMALYNAIEAKLAATKSHVMDTKRVVQELPEFIKKEIKGELGQLRLVQAQMIEVSESLSGKGINQSPNKSAEQ